MADLRLRFDFSGCRVLVTGGSNGIGLGVARGFAEAGARVQITGTRSSASDYDHDLAAFEYASVDVRDPEALDALAASIESLDILVNNAGANLAMRNEYEITDAIQIFLDDGYKVEAAEVVVEDVNVSYPPDLLDLNLRLLERQGQANWTGANVQVASSARLDRCVLMDGAVVEGDARLHECMLLPGSKVAAGRSATRVIFTPRAEIRCLDDQS